MSSSTLVAPRGKVKFKVTRNVPIQQRTLRWLREHVDERIPRLYYKLVLGHDAHVTMFGRLYIRVMKAGTNVWINPYTGKEALTPVLVSEGLVTTTFRDDIVDALDDDAGSGQLATFNDYKYHEVGTDNTAESNAHTALQATSGISRVSGTQAQPSSNVYESVATITADATETWQEHGIFNASSSGQLMDRSVFTGIAVESSDQVEFTYQITFTAES